MSNMFENWKNLIEKARKLDKKSLEAIRFAIFGIIIADIFGLWYVLGAKKIAGALLVFLIIALTIILILEKNLPIKKQKEVKPKMDEEKQEEKKEEKEEYLDLTEEDSKEPVGKLNLGLPSAEEYQRRVDDALGTF